MLSAKGSTPAPKGGTHHRFNRRHWPSGHLQGSIGSGKPGPWQCWRRRYELSGDDAFFVARAGAVWACFLDGKPAVRLGLEKEFWKAVTTFYDERHPEEKAEAVPAPSATPSSPPPPPPPPRALNERTAPRHHVSIVGRVFTTGGGREAIISDLSTTGCRFDDYSGRSIKNGRHLTIRIGTVGPIPATVRWTEGTAIGILFDTALHPSVLEHIRLQFGRV